MTEEIDASLRGGDRDA